MYVLSDRITHNPLLTDLYQLKMLQTYYERGMEETAVFEFFVRRLPRQRNFLLVAGIEQVLEYLEQLAFAEHELDWLRSCGHFKGQFVDRLEDFRFTGDVHGMPEGSVFFPPEPILRVTASLPEAQFIESRLINLIHYQTMIASKAARCVLQAPDKTLVDFGMRRAHGAEAALMAARASYIAGFTGTATVLAGQFFDIPAFGPMAHSFIQAHDTERDAFLAFAKGHRENVVLLIDTYDTERGASIVTEIAAELRDEGILVNAVRLDSGDVGKLSFKVRQILDESGCTDIKLFASGNLDEYRLAELIDRGCPVDGFGIGTRLDISEDAPSLDCVYKLQEYAGRGRRKRSEGKETWPGRKQVYRVRGANGDLQRDTLSLVDERVTEGEPLIVPLMQSGRRLNPPEDLGTIRERVTDQLRTLPDSLRALDAATEAYPVTFSNGLEQLATEVDRSYK